MDKSYPTTAWTQIFTDGSAENATRNGGCGIYTRQPNKPPITLAIPGGDLCSNYRAEAQALLIATETVTQLETRPNKVVLLTDPHIWSAITRIRKSTGRLHLTKCNTKFKQPDIKNNSLTSMDTSHTGIYGNKVVNQLAKEGSKKQQPKSKLSYQEAKTLIRNKRLADFKHINGG